MPKTKQKDSPEWLVPQKSASGDWLQPSEKKSYKHLLKKPRWPTVQEQRELIDFIMEKDSSPQDQRSNLESMLFVDSAVVIFDNYSTYYGEYEGKLLVIIGDLDPMRTSSFIWRNGKIEEVTRSTFKQIRQEVSK